MHQYDDVRNLIVFDLDGTLLDTTEIDSACFAAACRQELGIPCAENWQRFEHVTDSGIARELVRRGRLAGAATKHVQRVKRRFIGLLDAATRLNPGAFRPIPGAEALIKVLSRDNWCAAIATGGWRSSAKIKIKASGGFLNGLPLATSDRTPSRESIVQHAIDLARKRYAVDRFARIVLVGDGTWDVRAAHRLSLPFIGIGRDQIRDRLLASGAREVIDHFIDCSSFLLAIENAVTPRVILNCVPHEFSPRG